MAKSSEYRFENGTEFRETVALAAEPSWIEVPREELVRRQYALSALIGKLQSMENTRRAVLTPEDKQLLEDIWEMHVELLK